MSWNTGQGLKGAAGGALAGSAFGPAGTIIGGGLGLLAGGFGSGENEQDAQYRKMLMDYYGQGPMQAPQLGNAAQSAYSGFRQNQTGLVNRLEAMANGQGPSLARQQFEQATDRNMRGQQAMAASGRGGPLAQLTAANNMAQLGANAAQGSALARTNEQMQAIGQLGGVIAQGRGADEQTNMWNAGQSNQFAIQNLGARMDAMGMDQQRKLQLLSQMGNLNNGQRQTPGMGDQIMAGGAGLYSMAATQRAQQRATGGGGFQELSNYGYGSGGPAGNQLLNPWK